MIDVIDLSKSFPIAGRSLAILKGVTISIQKGEMLAIVGASGVGKSTFLHLLGALDRPTAGKVFFEGTDLFSQSDRELAEFRNKKIGFVFQFHHLLPEFTALENVMMPGLIQRLDQQRIEASATQMLQAVGLSHRLHHRPGQLSGGEQQRVAIARSLVLEPQLVLADEPTGNLDTHTSDEIFALLKTLNRERGITFVVVTHNEKLSLQADRLIKMVDGKIEGG
ncbi:MAG: ABC transporter ATP-binding protein [Candidatus Manganitrophaceae bacterium]